LILAKATLTPEKGRTHVRPFLCHEITGDGCLIMPLGEGEQQVLIRAPGS
jgi:hypothetical protein